MRDLARRTGSTVHTLHHYDAIGLLKPSLHTEAVYRLDTAGCRAHRPGEIDLMTSPAYDPADCQGADRIVGQAEARPTATRWKGVRRCLWRKALQGSGSVGTATRARSRRRFGAAARSAPAESHGPVARLSAVVVYLTASAGAIATACAWLVPETVLMCALGLGWAPGCSFIRCICGRLIFRLTAGLWSATRSPSPGSFRRSRPSEGSGRSSRAWSSAIFVVLGALLFPVFSFVYRNLHPFVDRFALRTAIAMAVAELVTIRLFPWHYGHTQIAFRPFVQLAGIGGAILVSFVLFWVAEAAVRAIVFRERRRGFLLPLVVFGLSLDMAGM